MTEREQEILAILRENPLISQEALANQLMIQRSSVAVHISNLIKKGYIKGKGYILNDEPYVVVIGGSNMDILGYPECKMKLHDSNIGFVKTSTGGVARNIAENLLRLGVQVKLISAVGDDDFGKTILSELEQLKMDTSGILIHQKMNTSTYLSVADETGDMHVAISQMNIVDELTVSYLNSYDSWIQNAECLVLDTNLSQEALDFLLSKYQHKSIYVDTVSTAKASKIKKHLKSIDFLKPNLFEALLLTEESDEVTKPEVASGNYKKLSDRLRHLGVKKVVVSLGAQGVYAQDDQVRFLKPIIKTKVVNTSGAGDAFMAGMVYAYIRQMSFSKAIEFAMACSRHNIGQSETVSKALNETSILNLIEEGK